MMRDKIKELTAVMKELGKFLDEAINIAGKLTLLVMAIITLLQIIKGG